MEALPEDLAEILLAAALAFDEYINTGQLPPGRAEQSLMALLLVRDHLLPLPPRMTQALAADFADVVQGTREARGALGR